MPRTSRHVALLSNTALSAGVTGVAGTPVVDIGSAEFVALEAIFVRAGGGTTCKVWVQTSLDGGATWFDIACFAFTITTASKLHAVRMDPATPLTPATAPGSGALADDTVLNGVIGDRLRTLLTTTGTYTGASSIEVHAVIKGAN